MTALSSMRWEIIAHPPDSPDLAHKWFPPVRLLKHQTVFWRTQIHQSISASQDVLFYNALEKRWNKCISDKGE